jgi:hypothetical protein
MILPDVNVLLYAYDVDSRLHAAARQWWERTLAGPRPLGMAWATLLGFIRITTHRGIFENPWRPAEAIRAVKAWLDHPRVQVVTPGEQHGAILFRLLETLGTAGNLTTDAHLAALAIEYQAEVASTDTDFARFRGLRWFNPLAEGVR